MQRAIEELAPVRRGTWKRKLDRLYGLGLVPIWGQKAAIRVCEIGDLGLHGANGVRQTVVANQTGSYAAFFLWTVGYEVSRFISPASIRGIRRYLGALSRTRWKGPAKFNGDWECSLFEGGLVEVLYACPACGGEVLVEDLEIPRPNGSGDNQEQSYAYGHAHANCLSCGADGAVLSTNSFGGWCVDTDGMQRRFKQQNRRGVSPLVDLPTSDHYLVHVELDYSDHGDQP